MTSLKGVSAESGSTISRTAASPTVPSSPRARQPIACSFLMTKKATRGANDAARLTSALRISVCVCCSLRSSTAALMMAMSLEAFVRDDSAAASSTPRSCAARITSEIEAATSVLDCDSPRERSSRRVKDSLTWLCKRVISSCSPFRRELIYSSISARRLFSSSPLTTVALHNCGMRIADCGFEECERMFFIPQSEIRIPQSVRLRSDYGRAQ